MNEDDDESEERTYFEGGKEVYIFEATHNNRLFHIAKNYPIEYLSSIRTLTVKFRTSPVNGVNPHRRLGKGRAWSETQGMLESTPQCRHLTYTGPPIGYFRGEYTQQHCRRSDSDSNSDNSQSVPLPTHGLCVYTLDCGCWADGGGAEDACLASGCVLAIITPNNNIAKVIMK